MIVLHFLLGILYIIIPIIFVLYYRIYYITDSNEKFFFLWGFLLKIFGAVAAFYIYVFYYKGGDTTFYFDAGSILRAYILDYPDKFFEILTKDNLRYYTDINFVNYLKLNNYFNSNSTYLVSKIAFILNVLTFNSFLLTSILCSYFSFFASWKFYKFISFFSINYKKQIGYAIFFMPSVIFWGSGLFKDTFTLAGLNLFLVGALKIFAYKRISFRNIIYLLVGYFLMVNIRSFFLLAVLPFIAIWILSENFYSIKSYTLKFLLVPLFVVIIFTGGFFIIQSIVTSFQELSFENIVDKSKGFQSWHTTLKGSAYSLGEVTYSTTGIISKMPASINVTLFRPYIWEANKIVIVMSAVQSFIFLLLTVWLLIKLKIIYVFTNLFKSPIAMSLLGFSLFYSFVVGFTSFNFGALDRYKIPCLSSYVIALIFIYENYKNSILIRK